VTIGAALFSSSDAEWETPREVFRPLHREFKFTLDVAATARNAMVRRYYDRALDGLSQVWRGRCWLNPPYGEPEQPCRTTHTAPRPHHGTACKKKRCAARGWHTDVYIPGAVDFIQHAAQAAHAGTAQVVVCLLPARTDTAWFHDWVMRAAEVRLIRGRLSFVGAPSAAPFPSMVVVFRGRLRPPSRPPRFTAWDL